MTSRKSVLILMHNNAIQFVDIANQYSKLFDPEKYKVTVVYLTSKPDEAFKKTQAEEIIYLNYSKTDLLGLKIKIIKKLISLSQQEKFTIVIAHRYKPVYVMLMAAQFCQIPVLIFVMHAMGTMNFIGRKLLIAQFARKNMYFAGVSNAVRDDLRKNIWRVPHDRIITLYNSIDIKLAETELLNREDARLHFNLPHDAFIFGTIGRLAREKDQKTLILAFAQVKTKVPNAKLLIIGRGPLMQNLSKLTEKLNLQNDVIFTGFVAQAFRYLKALDTFVLSSVKEAFGRALIEAMLAKVPTIGTRTNGIPEVIGNAGIIVEPKNIDQLSAAMLEMTQCSEEEVMYRREKVYTQLKNNFSTERFNETFWGLKRLREILSPHLNFSLDEETHELHY